MTKGKSVENSVAFFWQPVPYPVMWADSVEDVPEWDTSRGCPLSVSERDLQTWEVTPAPEHGYPRLVRRSFSKRVAPVDRTRDDIVNELLPLFRRVEEWRQGKNIATARKYIKKLAGRYGAPDDPTENTLERWLAYSAFAETYVWALNKLQKPDSGFFGLEEALLSERLFIERGERFQPKELGLREIKRFGPTNDKNEVRKMLEAIGRVEAPLQQTEVSFLDEPMKAKHAALTDLLRQLDTVDGVSDNRKTAAFRVNVATKLYNDFGRFTAKQREGLSFIPTVHGIVAFVPWSCWLHYKLAELWRHDVSLKVCPTCGKLFAPRHGNRKHCYWPDCRKQAPKGYLG